MKRFKITYTYQPPFWTRISCGTLIVYANSKREARNIFEKTQGISKETIDKIECV